MAELKKDLQHAIDNINALNKLKKQIEMTLTPEGLRIELMEDAKGTFFQSGSSQPTPILVEILKVLSAQLGTLPNRVSIEGHTDAQPYSNEKVYSNWELSSDRANVARRLMQTSGVRTNQVSQVRGFADQRLRTPQHPLDASNRRISLIVQYLDGGAEEPLGAAAQTQSQAGAVSSSPHEAPLTAKENPGTTLAAR